MAKYYITFVYIKYQLFFFYKNIYFKFKYKIKNAFSFDQKKKTKLIILKKQKQNNAIVFKSIHVLTQVMLILICLNNFYVLTLSISENENFNCFSLYLQLYFNCKEYTWFRQIYSFTLMCSPFLFIILLTHFTTSHRVFSARQISYSRFCFILALIVCQSIQRIVLVCSSQILGSSIESEIFLIPDFISSQFSSDCLQSIQRIVRICHLSCFSQLLSLALSSRLNLNIPVSLKAYSCQKYLLSQISFLVSLVLIVCSRFKEWFICVSS